MNKKSPFLVIPEFLPPMACERILDDLPIGRMRPLTGQDGTPREMVFHNQLNTLRIMQVFDPVVDNLEAHYETTYLGTHKLMFEWYPRKYNHKKLVVDSHLYDKKEGWKLSNRIDFTGILWLTTYNDQGDFEPSFETYGGNLNFPNFDINFKPQRGTMVIFPSTPNFVYCVGPVHEGNLVQVHLQIRSEGGFQFRPEDYETDPTKWGI